MNRELMNRKLTTHKLMSLGLRSSFIADVHHFHFTFIIQNQAGARHELAHRC